MAKNGHFVKDVGDKSLGQNFPVPAKRHASVKFTSEAQPKLAKLVFSFVGSRIMVEWVYENIAPSFMARLVHCFKLL